MFLQLAYDSTFKSIFLNLKILPTVILTIIW